MWKKVAPQIPSNMIEIFFVNLWQIEQRNNETPLPEPGNTQKKTKKNWKTKTEKVHYQGPPTTVKVHPLIGPWGERLRETERVLSHPYRLVECRMSWKPRAPIRTQVARRGRSLSGMRASRWMECLSCYAMLFRFSNWRDIRQSEEMRNLSGRQTLCGQRGEIVREMRRVRIIPVSILQR